jgi:hypothetical protein
MSSVPLSPEQRAQKWGTVAKWLAFAVVGFLVSPFILATIEGMLGLLVAGAIAGGVYFAMPALQSAAINMRLKMIKAEAAKNPIETLEAEYLRRADLLDQRKQAIATFDAKTRTFGDKLDGFKRDYPAEAPKYQQIYDNMLLLLKRQNQQWMIAAKGLKAFDGEIKKARAMWEMAKAAAAAQAGSQLGDEEFYAKLKVETSLDAIQDGMNGAFSQLDTLLLEADNDGALPAAATQAALPAPNQDNVIDADFVKTSTSTPVHVSR